MNEKEMMDNDAIEIDVGRIADAIVKKGWLITAVSVACAVLTLVVTLLFVTPKYESSAMFYVNNNSVSLGDAALSITSSDISASRGLVQSYIVILNTRESLNDVIDYTGVSRTYKELKEMISAEAVDDTEIFKVVVTSEDATEAEKIANGIAYILPKRITSIIEGTSAKIVDSAVIASRPSSPSYVKNGLIGFLLGFVLSAGIVALRMILDVTIRKQEDIEQYCNYPVLTAVPDMEQSGKGGYDYSYDREKKLPAHTGKKPVLIGEGISFAASESYKLLRTKLQFSFADENKTRVIGVSSSVSGEGKSLTAINLAFSLSQLGKKVILVDCDMRRPTVAEKLNIQKKPGMSNFLTGQNTMDELLQYCNIAGDERAFYVIAAGPNPPNPVELLSSERMSRMLMGLRKLFDYVILDLPPVAEVSDALAISKETDGMLLVVRQDHSNKNALKDTVRQFEFVGVKLLGIVYNGTTEGSTKYGKGYYRKYYQRSKSDSAKQKKAAILKARNAGKAK